MDSSVSLRLPNLAISEESKGTRQSLASENDSDEALMAELCLGSREALAILFRRYAGPVRVVSLRVLRDASEADDLVQDIFMVIQRLCTTFDRSKATVQFWIMQMAYHCAISRRRYLNCRHFYTKLELDDEQVQAPESRFRQPDDPINRVLAELDLQKLLGSISEDQQRTLRLHFIEGYTLDEIAKILGQTKGNIRNHSFRGLERLRKQIFAGKSPGTRAV